MKCPNCGAEFNGDVCEYCGSHFHREHGRQNRPGCPKCGSENISYSLQRNTWYTQETYGYCKDCGYSWCRGNNGFGGFGGFGGFAPEFMLWIAGWVLFFPIPLSILIFRAKSIPTAVRYILIAVLWLLVVFFYLYPFLSSLIFF